MKLEFLREGSPDCPLIRLYDFSSDEARGLQQVVLQLVRDKDAVVALHAEPGIQPVGQCELYLRQAENPHGIREIGPLKFEWTYSAGGWLEVAALIQPFCRGDSTGNQWLTRIGTISVLLSPDGRW